MEWFNADNKVYKSS